MYKEETLEQLQGVRELEREKKKRKSNNIKCQGDLVMGFSLMFSKNGK